MVVWKDMKKAAESVEDKVSSFVIVMVCMSFLLYVGYQTVSMNKMITKTPTPAQSAPQVVNPKTGYDCSKHSGDYTACVNAQVSGMGCSWYSDCKACITGSHDGRTFEEICGRKQQ